MEGINLKGRTPFVLHVFAKQKGGGRKTRGANAQTTPIQTGKYNIILPKSQLNKLATFKDSDLGLLVKTLIKQKQTFKCVHIQTVCYLMFNT